MTGPNENGSVLGRAYGHNSRIVGYTEVGPHLCGLLLPGGLLFTNPVPKTAHPSQRHAGRLPTDFGSHDPSAFQLGNILRPMNPGPARGGEPVGGHPTSAPAHRRRTNPALFGAFWRWSKRLASQRELSGLFLAPDSVGRDGQKTTVWGPAVLSGNGRTKGTPNPCMEGRSQWRSH